MFSSLACWVPGSLLALPTLCKMETIACLPGVSGETK